MTPDKQPVYEDKPLSHAGFLGWALGFVALIALSVVGMSHGRQIRGDANLQFWIVVALLALALSGITLALARTPIPNRRGDLIRQVVVGVAAIGIVLFVWETTALGLDLAGAPSMLIARLLGF